MFLIFLLFTPTVAITKQIHCSKNVVCPSYCYNSILYNKTGCIRDVPELTGLCCPSGNKCLLLKADTESWYSEAIPDMTYCCSYSGCLNVPIIEFPTPQMRYRFYSSTIYYILFGISIILITVIGGYPLSYQLYKNSNVKKNKEVSLKPDLEKELFTHLWPKELKVSKTTKATGIIPLTEMHDVIKKIQDIEEHDKIRFGSPEKHNINITYDKHYMYKKGGHDMVMYARVMPTKYEAVLHQMLEHGPGSFTLEAVEINEVLDRAHNIFAAEPSLIEISTPCVVIGELRASYPDLFRWLQLTAFPHQKTLVFTGGVFESDAPGATETLVLVSALKVAMPYAVYVIQGASELAPYSFFGRFGYRISNGLSAAVDRMFCQIPLAVLVDKKILLIHSGINSKLKTLDSIRKICRPINRKNTSSLIQSLIYGLPTYKPIDRISDLEFTEQMVYDICEKLNLELIIRSRGRCPQGHFVFANRKMLSLWSQSGRNEEEAGSVATIEKTGTIKLHSIYGADIDEDVTQ